jgi:hypothetical protein
MEGPAPFVAPLQFRSGRPARAEAIEHGQQFGRIRTLGVVGIDFRIGDDAVGADHIACRHWQYPGRILVDDSQIVAEPLVDLDQVIRQREADAEGVTR